MEGFDTHADQLNTHAGLLREVGDSLRAFVDDLTRAGEARRVLVLVYSEFGRRVPSAGNGTDHGAAAPVFLIGPCVRPGLHGPYPNLQDLDNLVETHRGSGAHRTRYARRVSCVIQAKEAACFFPTRPARNARR
jgi:uncharacterized protein (DUF1501 family)